MKKAVVTGLVLGLFVFAASGSSSAETRVKYLRLGMNPQEVAAIVGQPVGIVLLEDGNTLYRYEFVSYQGGGLLSGLFGGGQRVVEPYNLIFDSSSHLVSYYRDEAAYGRWAGQPAAPSSRYQASNSIGQFGNELQSSLQDTLKDRINDQVQNGLDRLQQ